MMRESFTQTKHNPPVLGYHAGRTGRWHRRGRTMLMLVLAYAAAYAAVRDSGAILHTWDAENGHSWHCSGWAIELNIRTGTRGGDRVARFLRMPAQESDVGY